MNLDKITKALDRLPDQFKDRVAQFGVPQGLEYEDGTSVAYVAAIQEFGAPEAKIPPRPFLRPSIAQDKDKWVKILEAQIPKVQAGQITADQALLGVGAVAVGDIQAMIASINSPPLSPITVLLRKWRKQGKTISGKTVGEAAQAIAAGVDPGSDNKPLNDTGYLMSSIRNAVNDKDGEFKA